MEPAKYRPWTEKEKSNLMTGHFLKRPNLCPVCGGEVVFQKTVTGRVQYGCGQCGNEGGWDEVR
jgi:hypothetical protein